MEIKESNKHGPLDSKTLEEFERNHSFKIPEEYRQHLLRHNGGKPDPAHFDFPGNGSAVHGPFYGLHEGPDYARLEESYEIFSERIPAHLMAIASDPFGNQVCLAISGKQAGGIFFWDHELEGEAEAVIPMADSFQAFLGMLYEWDNPDEPLVEKIIKKQDLSALKEFLAGGFDLETGIVNGRTMMEQAAIHARNDIIAYLFSRGAQLRNALEYARKNAEHFESHVETVKLLEKLASR